MQDNRAFRIGAVAVDRSVNPIGGSSGSVGDRAGCWRAFSHRVAPYYLLCVGAVLVYSGGAKLPFNDVGVGAPLLMVYYARQPRRRTRENTLPHGATRHANASVKR